MPRTAGKCKWFDPKKGYGFITLDNGEDVFVHQSEIHANGFRSLREEERVELDVVLENNKKKAIRVTGPRGDYVRGAESDGRFHNYDGGYRQEFRDFERGRRY
ncbi:cold shock protein, putative [Theileria equi strain WA]|uniref:Cold shock protein, putative n=1 Tax=Theileria equi strain WA TaxID=1537102 RepID=L1LDR6_THEEQ|nr:cold shock protein, putative [Theileria equi strain WA]EKX73390.1 cold shock protein, putative [Theileria equi strain WA]|eukprot:XP_004832842.1 cold shock protein, putative [Theileria equi strain WA]